MTDRRIHLVFKTHLDIGFTDHAAQVRRQYHEQFIPQAIDDRRAFLRRGSRAPGLHLDHRRVADLGSSQPARMPSG